MSSQFVRAIRGATTIDEDTREQMLERIPRLLEDIFERNAIGYDDLISILFTATDDLHAMFPAEAARSLPLADVPLTCARELDIEGSMPRCVRVMVHCYTARSRRVIDHVYHEGAVTLRNDLAP